MKSAQVPASLRPPCSSLCPRSDSCLLSYGGSCSTTESCSTTRCWTSSPWRRASSPSCWVPVRELISRWTCGRGWGLSQACLSRFAIVFRSFAYYIVISFFFFLLNKLNLCFSAALWYFDVTVHLGLLSPPARPRNVSPRWRRQPAKDSGAPGQNPHMQCWSWLCRADGKREEKA